jgi:hypothetical protein
MSDVTSDPQSYYSRFLDNGDVTPPEDAGFDPELKETLAKLYERQAVESLRMYNNTARPEEDIDHDMANLDGQHEIERNRYIRDYQAAKDLREKMQESAKPLDNSQTFSR